MSEGKWMWALVKDKADVGLTLKQVPIPKCGKNDVKIKIRKTSICGTDVHIYNWNEWAQHTIPVINSVGITAALSNLMQSLTVIVINQFLLAYGNDKIAAMGIVLKVNMIAQQGRFAGRWRICDEYSD